jgi:hypothetical protein
MVSRSASQNKALIAITAINGAAFINFKPNTGVAKRASAWNIRRTVARHAVGFHFDGFGGCHHRWAFTKAA